MESDGHGALREGGRRLEEARACHPLKETAKPKPLNPKPFFKESLRLMV